MAHRRNTDSPMVWLYRQSPHWRPRINVCVCMAWAILLHFWGFHPVICRNFPLALRFSEEAHQALCFASDLSPAPQSLALPSHGSWWVDPTCGAASQHGLAGPTCDAQCPRLGLPPAALLLSGCLASKPWWAPAPYPGTVSWSWLQLLCSREKGSWGRDGAPSPSFCVPGTRVTFQLPDSPPLQLGKCSELLSPVCRAASNLQWLERWRPFKGVKMVCEYR